MKQKITLTAFMFLAILFAFGQRPILNLTFTANDNSTYMQLNSIRIMNRTQGGDTILYWPDTVMEYQVGISEIRHDATKLQLFQNYPNPVVNQTVISLCIPDKDNVNLTVTDMLGRIVHRYERVLDKGTHSFRFVPGGANLYILTAQWRENSNSIKILQGASYSCVQSSLDYIGSEASSHQLKATEDLQSFSFKLGDELLFIGYSGTLQSGILDTPQESKTYTFQFATNIPCPGLPEVEYGGQVYNTIQIFNQCWLKENLNVGTMINGSDDMGNNSIMEKYCYDNEPDSCVKYGGLYQWNEMMQYTLQQGSRGICPPGWHLPTDEEWKVLQGAVDSHYAIGSDEWDDVDFRGFDAGINLKATHGWYSTGNGEDLFGFTCLPGGNRDDLLNNFFVIGFYAYWWTSTDDNDECAWLRIFDWDHNEIYRGTSLYSSYDDKNSGFSVRCIRD